MSNIHPAEHSHGIDLEHALDFLNTLHPVTPKASSTR
jgi:hypothetical protein